MKTIRTSAETLEGVPSRRGKALFYGLFVAINLLLSCYYLDVWITPNAASRAIPVLTLYENKTIIIDKYVHYAVDVSHINGHYYSNKAPLSTFIVYPFYAAYKSMGLPELKDFTLKKYPIYILENINSNVDARSQLLPKSAMVFIIGDVLCGAIPFVMMLLLSLLALERITSDASSVIVVMLTFYGAFVFSYAGTYTGHILAGFLALVAYILVKRKEYLFSGIMLGLAVATEYPLGILIPLWAILIFINEKKISKALIFMAGIMPGLLIVILYNYHLTGSLFQTTYSYEVNEHKQNAHDIGLYLPKISVLWKLIFSTYRGILYYTPVLFFILWYALKYVYQTIIKRIGDKMEYLKAIPKNYLFITVLAYLLFYSAYYEWDGGWSFGPRYLIPIVVILLYEGVIFLSARPFPRNIFYLVTGIGVILTWMDKSTKIFQIPSNEATFGNPVFSIIIPDFFKHKFNTNTLPVFLFNSNPVVAIYTWPLLFITGLIVLVIGYSKLYSNKKINSKLYLSIVPLFILFLAIIITQGALGNNNLSMDNSGIFGAWKYYDLADEYRDAAQNTQDPNQKRRLYSEAANAYRKVMQYFPNDPDCNFYLGTCYFFEGYPDSAIIPYKQTLMLKPKFSEASRNLGLIYANKALMDSALHYFIMSYKTDSNMAALIDMGAAYQQEGSYAVALHYDSLALKRDSRNEMAIRNMSSILEIMKKKQ
jgi:tetratricopeptide (TPR) repeat protein